MSSGQMNAQSKWRVTEDLPVETVVKPLVQNQGRIHFCMTYRIIKYICTLYLYLGLNTQPKFMFGLG